MQVNIYKLLSLLSYIVCHEKVSSIKLFTIRWFFSLTVAIESSVNLIYILFIG